MEPRMTDLRPRLLVLAFFLCSLTIFAADTDRIRTAAPAEWIDRNEKVDLKVPASKDATAGFDILLSDEQIHVGLEARYLHMAYRITSAEAVQRGSQVSVNFDPEYESIDFHQLQVFRDGQPSNRLVLENFKTFQQEKELERYQFNGQLTALMVLNDIRVGDTIDFAYTRHGRNPVFDGRFSDQTVLQSTTPAHVHRLRVITKSDRPLFSRVHGRDRPAQERYLADGSVERVWRSENVPAVHVDPDIPAGYIPFPYLQLSEFDGWASVVQWGLPLYAMPEAIPASVAEKAKEVTSKAVSPEEKVLACLMFVQEEIRYLGIELGVHSHRPNPPELVLERRYGDCKDKVVLFCTMLSALKLQAVPCLTHSVRSESMEELLPDAGVFNHVIARVDLDGRSYFVDPTLTGQAGLLQHRGLPEYEWVLPVEAGQTKLQKIDPDWSARAAMSTHEEYWVNGYGAPVTLNVRSVFHGLWADANRSYYRLTDPGEIEKYLLNNRSRFYPKISLAEPLKWESNDRLNTFVVTAKYRIEDGWQAVQGSSRKSVEFYPVAIWDYLYAPRSQKRTMPLGLSYPARISYTATIHTPENLRDRTSSKTIDSEFFKGVSAFKPENKAVQVEASFTVKTRGVPQEKVPQYVQDLRDFRQALGYTISYDPAALERNKVYRFNWYIAALGVAAVILSTAGAVYLYRIPIPPVPVPETLQSLSGLSGWLIIVAFGLCLRPVMQLVGFVRAYQIYFDARVWENLTRHDSNGYLPWFGTLCSIEIVCQIALLVVGGFLLVTFFKKRRIFPRIFVGYLVGLLVFNVADQLAVYWLQDRDLSFGKEFYQLAGYSLIWIPYMLRSQRVRATFVNGREPASPAMKAVGLADAVSS
jgi:hypothetical protein